jgi:hypothetical protein
MKELLFAIAVGQTFLSDLSDNKGTDKNVYSTRFFSSWLFGTEHRSPWFVCRKILRAKAKGNRFTITKKIPLLLYRYL